MFTLVGPSQSVQQEIFMCANIFHENICKKTQPMYIKINASQAGKKSFLSRNFVFIPFYQRNAGPRTVKRPVLFVGGRVWDPTQLDSAAKIWFYCMNLFWWDMLAHCKCFPCFCCLSIPLVFERSVFLFHHNTLYFFKKNVKLNFTIIFTAGERRGRGRGGGRGGRRGRGRGWEDQARGLPGVLRHQGMLWNSRWGGAFFIKK